MKIFQKTNWIAVLALLLILSGWVALLLGAATETVLMFGLSGIWAALAAYLSGD